MEEMIKGRGKTVLLVSHNIRQVERMCSRVMMLDHGHVLADGPTAEVCDLFYQQSNSKIHAQAQQAAMARISSSGEVTIDSIDILDDFGNVTNDIESGGKLRIRIKCTLQHDLEGIEIIVGTHRTDFIYISSASTREVMPNMAFSHGLHEIEYIVPSFPLCAGTYSVRLAFLGKNMRILFNGESLKTFIVKAKRMENLNNQWKTVNLTTELSIDGKHYVVPA